MTKHWTEIQEEATMSRKRLFAFLTNDDLTLDAPKGEILVIDGGIERKASAYYSRGKVVIELEASQ